MTPLCASVQEKLSAADGFPSPYEIEALAVESGFAPEHASAIASEYRNRTRGRPQSAIKVASGGDNLVALLRTFRLDS